jgi:hypothetical protein
MRLAAALVAASLLAGTAHAEPDHAAGPFHIDFRLDASEHKSPLAAGSLETEPFQSSRFETQELGAVSKLQVDLFARPQVDGTVAVELDLNEVDANGRVVKWRPAMQGKRGVPLTATIRAGDISRTITVTVR